MRVTDEQRMQHKAQFHSITSSLAIQYAGIPWHNDNNAKVILSKYDEPIRGFHLWLDTWSAKAGFVTVTPMWPSDSKGRVVLPRDVLPSAEWSVIETTFNSARDVSAIVGQINRAFMPEYQRMHAGVVAYMERDAIKENAHIVALEDVAAGFDFVKFIPSDNYAPFLEVKGINEGQVYGDIYFQGDGTFKVQLDDVPGEVAREILEVIRRNRK